MKKYIKIAVLGAVILTSASCKKYLDVNTNPNDPTYSTPNIVLPQAILTSANTIVAYDSFGAWTAGYKANAGGYGGFGTQWTYEFTTNDYTGMWTGAFGALNQLNYVIANTTPTGPLKYYNAMARVMKAWVYTRLIDQYGDVPYSQTGQGLNNLSPAYDKYSDVYKALYADLDASIAVMATAPVTNVTVAVTSGQDPLYGGSSTANLAKWTAFANTIKLKMLVRTQAVADLSAWVTASKATLPTSSAGYITDDAVVNPGFSSSTASQMNPRWTSYAWDLNGTAIGSGLSQLPTPWILSFYNGGKLTDPERGKEIYLSYGATVSQTIAGVAISFTGPATNQLGYDVEPVKRSANGSYWYSGYAFPAGRVTGTAANSSSTNTGVLKSATMGQNIFTAAESYFLQAEAALPTVSIIPALAGSSKALFENGIIASYNYLGKNPAGTYVNTTPAATLFATYKTANATSPLVNFDLAVTPAQQLEAIITQKYIAVNFIHSEEGFNEFRRTGYPTIVQGSTVATETFVSLKAPNNLPGRVLYPAVEFQVNSTNVPKGVTPKTKIFYAK